MVPQSLNYRMPAEWALHERTFVSWPVRDTMCFPENYQKVCRGYCQIVRAIAQFEPVGLIVNSEDADTVRNLIPANVVSILALAHDDSWIRDNGPTFLCDSKGNRAGVSWQFNAWGEKYRPYDQDDRLASELLKTMQIRRFDAPLVLEGGSFSADGEGTLLTTEQCLLNSNRNPDKTREEIEDYLKKYLNIEKIIWLKNGLSGDETDGHVDNLACFAAPGKIMIQVCRDPEDDNYAVSQENLRRLRRVVDARDRKIEIIPIQQPPARIYRGHRLTLSYLNFYFVNGGLILPVFADEAAETDRLAQQTLRALFPNRQICPIDGTAIVTEGGNIHCATQQMPAPEEEKI